MDTRPRSPWPQLTAMWGGAGLAISGVALMIDFLRLSLPLLRDFNLPLWGIWLTLTGHMIQAAASAVLAIGLAGEVSLAGSGVAARACMVIWGAGPLCIEVIALVPWTVTSAPLLPNLSITIRVATGLAAIAASLLVLRARTVGPLLRWGLVPLAVCVLVAAVAQASALLINSFGTALTAMYELHLALMIITGCGYLVFGRVEAIKYYAATIRKAW